MNGFHTLDVEDDLLSSAVGLTCAVQAKFTLPGVKTEEAVCRKGLFFVRAQSENISVKCSNSPHIFDEEYNTSYIHATASNPVPQIASLVKVGNNNRLKGFSRSKMHLHFNTPLGKLPIFF